MPAETGQTGNLWLTFALMTAASWGLYGIFLHTGQVHMGDPANGRYKAFLWVGVAYVLIAVLSPLAVLVSNGASWAMPMKGIIWSLIAGSVGAVGAFCVLLAFGAKGHPAVVMCIIFATAPIINAIVSLAMHPPAGGVSAIRWQFFAGILLAATGGMMVTLYKPGPGPAKPAPGTAAPAASDTAGDH